MHDQKGLPNLLLKRERELHGWSQEDLAENPEGSPPTQPTRGIPRAMRVKAQKKGRQGSSMRTDAARSLVASPQRQTLVIIKK